MAIVDRGSLLAGDRRILHTEEVGELCAVVTGDCFEYFAEVTDTDFALYLIEDVDGAHGGFILGDHDELHSCFPLGDRENCFAFCLSADNRIQLPMTEGDSFLNLFRSFFYAMLQVLELLCSSDLFILFLFRFTKEIFI